MNPKEVANYGAPFQDRIPVANPLNEQSSSQYNRHAEDSAQMTRTATRIEVKFATTTTSGPTPVTVLDASSVWGEGISYKPTISKTTTGTYVITYATEYDDALVGTEGNEDVAETEQVAFRFHWGSTEGSTLGHVRSSSVDNVITVYVFNAAGSLSDLGGGIVCSVFAR